MTKNMIFLGFSYTLLSQRLKSKLTLTDRNMQVRFEGGFEILRLYIFWHCNQFLWNASVTLLNYIMFNYFVLFSSILQTRKSRVCFFTKMNKHVFFIFFRYKSLKMGYWMKDSTLIKYSNIIFCLAYIYGAGSVLANFLFDIRIINLVLICEKGEEAEKMNSGLNLILLTAPICFLVKLKAKNNIH